MRKVAIVGSAPTREDAPWSDSSWEIWTLNDMVTIASRMDRMFEMHEETMLLEDVNTHPGMAREIEWLKKNTTVPVFMRSTLDWVPSSTEYPLDAIVKEFGDYFTNTVSYMIALALYESVDELGIWGVHMEHMTEYADQRPSCEYFIGVARGRGIPVYVHPKSSLLSCRELYGSRPDRFRQDIEERIKMIRNSHAEQGQVSRDAQLKQAKAEGGIEMLGYVLSTYG